MRICALPLENYRFIFFSPQNVKLEYSQKLQIIILKMPAFNNVTT